MPDRNTWTAVAASPALIGLGQQTLINILTYPAPSGPTYNAQSLVLEQSGFQNISCTITAPDGTKSTFMPVDDSIFHATGQSTPGLAEIVGSLQFYYTPTQIGNYSVTASFPGQVYTTDGQLANANLSEYYKPSSSLNSFTFTVQKDPVLSGLLNGYPWSPLPTGYWTNPINTNNREWASITGAWVVSGYAGKTNPNYNPYTTAPLSPHVVWATQVMQSGLTGGVFGSLAYNDQAGGTGAIIMDGKIYQNEIGTSRFDCIDLRTGQLLWSAPYASGNTGLVGGWQILPEYQTTTNVLEGGTAQFLIGMTVGTTGTGSNTWVFYNPFNGAVARTLTNVPTDIMRVLYNNGDNTFWMTEGNQNLYNTTVPLKLPYLNLIKWDYSLLSQQNPNLVYTQLLTNDWRAGIVFNVSLLHLPGQAIDFGDNNFFTTNAYPYDAAGVVVVQQHNDMQLLAGFSETDGKLLWVNNNTEIGLNGRDVIATSDAGPLFNDASLDWEAFDVKTGKLLYTLSGGDLPWAMLPDMLYVYNNNTLFMGSYDGHVYAYNIQTGARVWQSDYVGAEDESIYGNQPFNGNSIGGGGVLYYSTGTTYHLEPRTRFHALYAIDEATGHFIWKLPIAINPTAIAYGYVVGRDIENGIQYCIGKGQTSTKVTAEQQIGGSVMIQGSVMDMSPTKPNTPAVSEASMSEWMDYLYGQNATLINSPPTPQGVTVQLNAVDPNGNAIDLGTVTSDFSGQFAKSWTPTTAGLYTIYATFAGSNSYYSSYAETHATYATTASTASPAPTQATAVSNSDLMTYLVVGIVVLLIAITVVGALLYRKH